MVQFTWPRWIISGLVLALVACAGIGITVSEPAETGNQAPAVSPVEVAEQAVAATPLLTSTNTPVPTPTATAVEVAATATPAEAPEPAVQEAAAPEQAAAPAGPTEEQSRLLASLPAKGPAPELFNETWLNSEPLRLADLRGKVVIVEFWTFG